MELQANPSPDGNHHWADETSAPKPEEEDEEEKPQSETTSEEATGVPFSERLSKLWKYYEGETASKIGMRCDVGDGDDQRIPTTTTTII